MPPFFVFFAVALTLLVSRLFLHDPPIAGFNGFWRRRALLRHSRNGGQKKVSPVSLSVSAEAVGMMRMDGTVSVFF